MIISHVTGIFSNVTTFRDAQGDGTVTLTPVDCAPNVAATCRRAIPSADEGEAGPLKGMARF